FMFAPSRLDPLREVGFVTVSRGPRSTLLNRRVKLLHTKVVNQILHRDSAKSIRFIRVDGQSPASHRSFRGGFRFVLVKGAYLPLAANAATGGHDVEPTEHPNGDLAPINIQI